MTETEIRRAKIDLLRYRNNQEPISREAQETLLALCESHEEEVNRAMRNRARFIMEVQNSAREQAYNQEA